MKRIMVATVLIAAFNYGYSQKQFDSAAYAQFYKSLYPGFSIDTVTKLKDLSAEEKIEGLSKVWYEAKFNFANFDLVPSLNWDSIYRTFIPKVLATKDIISYYQLLKKFNQYLHDGHSRIYEPAAYFMEQTANLPLQFRLVDNFYVLTSIPSSDAAFDGLKKGWTVSKINNMEVNKYIRENVSPYLSFSTKQDSLARICNYEMLRGKNGSKVTIEFRDEKNRPVTRTFTRSIQEDLPLLDFKVLPGNIGYLQLNSFNDEKIVKMFDSLFDQINTTSSLIIDVRKNGGGSSQNGYEILGCLTDKNFYTDISVMRSYHPLERAWNNNPVKVKLNADDWKPYKGKYYNKPVVLLTDAATYSAAEDFTAAFKAMNRGKIFGQPTGGSTGQPMGYALPGGGLGFVCSKRDYMPGGEEFVGIGIQPDVKVDYTLAGIREGRDEVLDAAADSLKR